MYNIASIAEVLNAKAILNDEAAQIEYLLTDSRRVAFPASSLFFALSSSRRDGHQFIDELYNQGVRNFVVKKEIDFSLFPKANFLIVPDPLLALQHIAAWHRSHFSYPIIGILTPHEDRKSVVGC